MKKIENIKKHFTSKKFVIRVGIFFTLIFLLEISLRLIWGFCDAVLIREDPDFEYIAKPNQNRIRFRNNIHYNSHSMRSEEVDSNATIILGFGDSILNGGALTDQDSLATTILSDELSINKKSKVQFLNISAGSWGPDNCFAYLKKYGDFNAKKIYLILSSHDAYDNMNFEKIVGINKSFPSKQYALAIFELTERYLIPRVKTYFNIQNLEHNLGINKKKSNPEFNSGFLDFLTYTTKQDIEMVIFLHADTYEMKNGFYNDQGKEIIKFANQNNIPILTDISKINTSHFRDQIHINSKGQKLLASIILDFETKKK